MKKKINLISLGCSKNLVDSEVVLGNLEKSGFEIMHDSDEIADVVIVNTCGFINDAKEESIDTILAYAKAKESGYPQKLFVMGCLSQLYKDELTEELPEVDGIFGVDQFKDILNVVTESEYMVDNSRFLTTPKHYAYLKIAEGCNRKCSFCSIPIIRGKHISRPVDEIVQEAEWLSKQGVKELILISQDLSYYGYDLYGKVKLVELLKKLVEIEGIEWIRCQYLYPAMFPEGLAELMEQETKICNYIDLPLQHINDHMLKSMKRGIDKKDTFKLLNKIKQTLPDVCLRTSFIVGYPGETDEEFQELLDFIREMKFDRIGCFTYSLEENTTAAHLSNQIPEHIKNRRMEELMNVQQEISLELNSRKIAKTYQVIIDRLEGDYYIGRTQYDSPDVDNEVVISADNHDLKIGEFYYLTIANAEEFDLIVE